MLIIYAPRLKLFGAIVAMIGGLAGIGVLAAYLVGSESAAANAAKNLVPLTSSLPIIPGDPPTMAYPGTGPNGWTPTGTQTYQNIPPENNCTRNTRTLLGFTTSSYYYNDSTTIKGSDQASMTINTIVEPSSLVAALLERQVATKRYQACYAKRTTYLLNKAGLQVARSPSVTPLIIDVIRPGVAFESEALYGAARGLLPYYDATAIVRYRQYRAVVDIGRCCQAIPLYTLQNTVDLVEERMAVAPAVQALSLPYLVGLTAEVVGCYVIAFLLLKGYSDSMKQGRIDLLGGEERTSWSTRRH